MKRNSAPVRPWNSLRLKPAPLPSRTVSGKVSRMVSRTVSRKVSGSVSGTVSVQSRQRPTLVGHDLFHLPLPPNQGFT